MLRLCPCVSRFCESLPSGTVYTVIPGPCFYRISPSMAAAQSISAKEHGDRILAQLGQGGMAQIQLAVRLGPGGFRKLYVIKRLRRDLANEAYANLFMHEARLAALLSHPNVVQSHEVNQKIDDCYLKMEYLEGQTLARLVRRVTREQLPLEVHLYILTELLSGLHHAHELKDLRGNPMKVVHRDVSPGNVILTYDGQVKLLDFGIAQSTESVEQAGVGAIKGKIKYMSPEQAHGASVDRRSDLYSIGIMLWEAIACGPMVPRGQASSEVLQHRRQGRYRPIQEVVSDVSPALVEICDKALSLKPDDRYATAKELREAILEHLRTMPLKPGREEVGAIVQERFREEREKTDAMISEKISLGEDSHELLHPETITGFRDTPAANAAHPELRTQTNAAKRSKAPLLFVGLLAIGAAGAGFWFMNGGGLRHVDEPTQTVEAPITPTVAVASPPEKKPQKAIVKKIELFIRVLPETARIVLDGKVIGKGAVHSRLTRDTNKHRLVIEHPGYKKIERSLVLDSDIRLELNLVELEAGKEDDSQQAPLAKKHTAKKSRTKARTKVHRTPSQASTEEPKNVRKRGFGGVLRGRSGNRHRKIDKENPYQ